MNTRLNMEKLDENIVQKHEGSKQFGLKQLGSKQVGFKQLGQKQVGFKQLGPGVETGFHVSNDDTAVAQRWLEDKQPEEKTLSRSSWLKGAEEKRSPVQGSLDEDAEYRLCLSVTPKVEIVGY
ncbi:hypothetical protein Tco_1076658 [Tanacetum coccineum]